MSESALLPTPCFVLDEQALLDNYEALATGFRARWPDLVIGYSFKTNPLPWVITRLAREGAWAEVVSNREHELALRLGFAPDRVILNGPVKGFDCLRQALDDGAVVNLDSHAEVDWIERNRPTGHHEAWRVGVRVNFDLEAACPGETVAAREPGRFGFCVEDGSLSAAVARISRLPYVRVVGVHGHSSTRSRSLAVFEAITGALVRAANLLPSPPEYVDVGGGFFGGRRGDPAFARFPTMEQYADTIAARLRAGGIVPEHCRLIGEPGACLVATAFVYETSVVDVRDVRGTRLVTLDGSRLDVAANSQAPLACLPRATAARQPHPARQVLCGYTCIEMDRLADLPAGAPELAPGDRVVFPGIGGYGMSMAPLFIRHLKAVYVLPREGGAPFPVRDEWTAAHAAAAAQAYEEKV